MKQLEKPFQFNVDDWVVVFGDHLVAKNGVLIGQITEIKDGEISVQFYEWDQKDFMPSGKTARFEGDNGEYEDLYLLPEGAKFTFELREDYDES